MTRAILLFATGVVAFTTLGLHASGPQAQTPRDQPPRPVRNDVPRPGRELDVLRNHRLKKGGHVPFFQYSRDGLWPYFDRIGARVVGQWKIIEPAATGDVEDVYRLTRYASFQHWLGTRSGNQSPIGGDGPAWAKGQAGINDRLNFEVGSAGAYFLEGTVAPDTPIFMPPVPERYRLVESGQRPAATAPVIPVRAGSGQQPGQEIVELRYQRIRRGSFDQFLQATSAAIWPWQQKLGARPIGQWKVVYPSDPGDGSTRNSQGRSALQFFTTPSTEYDEVVTLTRFASAGHREAIGTPDRAVFEGGNGPDFAAWSQALTLQQSLTLSTKTEIMQGFMYDSPPAYLPALPERYERVP
jgi:hypothetical protein